MENLEVNFMFNVRVEYESTPIRHIAVQCPNCKKWFRGWEITEDNLRYAYEINFADSNVLFVKQNLVDYNMQINQILKKLDILPCTTDVYRKKKYGNRLLFLW